MTQPGKNFWLLLMGWDIVKNKWKNFKMVRAADCQCQSRNSHGFDPCILRHSGIWGAADEAVLNKVHKKEKFSCSFWKWRGNPGKSRRAADSTFMLVKKQRQNSNNSQFPEANKKYKSEILFLWVRWWGKFCGVRLPSSRAGHPHRRGSALPASSVQLPENKERPCPT